MGAEAEIKIDVGYPTVDNDEKLTNKAKELAGNYLGSENVSETELRMGAEDFGYYTQKVPGCFFRLGVRNEAVGIVHNVHTPKFNIDEKKSFVKIVKQGKISVYLIHYEGNTTSGGNGGMTVNSYGADAYYLQRENDDFAFAIGLHRYDLNFMAGMNLYAVVEMNFKEICPEFVNKLKEADLKATEFSRIVDIYEENCGKK